MGDQTVQAMQDEYDSPMAAATFPPYPQEHSSEAHARSKWIQEEIQYLDDHHQAYIEMFEKRRTELVTMLEMCHAAIETFDRHMGPQQSMPQSVPGRDSMPLVEKGQRTPYDTGIRAPKIR